jgi:ubiquitin thioesterase OTU1
MLGIASFSGQLRNLIVTAVSNDPVTFNEAFLGRSNKDYCDWIANPERWGGMVLT